MSYYSQNVDRFEFIAYIFINYYYCESESIYEYNLWTIMAEHLLQHLKAQLFL